jgi:hypothetical protein
MSSTVIFFEERIDAISAAFSRPSSIGPCSLSFSSDLSFIISLAFIVSFT